jgi:hypothetical protein
MASDEEEPWQLGSSLLPNESAGTLLGEPLDTNLPSIEEIEAVLSRDAISDLTPR